MNRYLLTGLGVSLCIAACSSNSDEHAPPPVADGGASSRSGAGGHASGGKSGKGGSSGTAHGGAGEHADGGAAGSSAGEAGAGGEGGMEEGEVIPVLPGACSEAATWESATVLPGISTAADEQLLSITPDELDILFLRDGSAMRAHRDTAGAAFDAAVALPIADGYGIDAGVALSADGKTMVLLATTGQSFAAFTRTSRSADFSVTPDESAFIGINQRALQTMQHYTAPVLSPNGATFVFAAFTPPPTGGFSGGFQGVSVVFESVWTGSAWAMPESISQDLFDGTTAARALPSALASDSRTLFYEDEASAQQMARFRDRPDAPLYTVVGLDQRTGAMPNVKCDRLYYSSGGDILFAE